ncbi:MAG: hypothetical protein J6S74_02195 [Alphaproteobacteria bacterium]|nr:hypothetical protein [Alphaproteobacteria bacterium]
MPKAKQDKYDVLAAVVDALYDENQIVSVETTNVDAKMAQDNMWGITEINNPQIATVQGKRKYGPYSINREHAQSIKIGKISIRRIGFEPTPTKDGKYLIDNGWKYIVHMPDGRTTAEFGQNDDDFLYVWNAALNKYDLGKGIKPSDMSKIMSRLYNNIKNPKVKESAGKGVAPKNNKTKYEKAIALLKEMDIQPKRLLAYIEKQSKENN